MTGAGSFDVLVIGSGASGLAAAVSAERAGARVGLATKGSIQACNSAKAQGGIQAAFGDDDSPEQHAADVFKSSHDSADMRLVEVLTGDAQSAIHWLEELGVEFTQENGNGTAYRLARCGGASREAPAPGRRPHRPRDHEGAARRVRGRQRHALRQQPAADARAAPRTAGARRCGEHDLDAATVVLAAGGRCYRVAEERDELSTNHPERDRRGDADRARPRAPRRATSTSSSTTRTAAPGRRRCRATRSRRRRAPTAPCC